MNDLLIVELLGNMPEFEQTLMKHAEQECRNGKNGPYSKLFTLYREQLEILRNEGMLMEKHAKEHNMSIKLVRKNISNRFDGQLYRWGFEGIRIGNYRIIYTIYDFYKVLLLHYFDKNYNGAIAEKDLRPAELVYLEYLTEYPSRYE